MLQPHRSAWNFSYHKWQVTEESLQWNFFLMIEVGWSCYMPHWWNWHLLGNCQRFLKVFILMYIEIPCSLSNANKNIYNGIDTYSVRFRNDNKLEAGVYCHSCCLENNAVAMPIYTWNLYGIDYFRTNMMAIASNQKVLRFIVRQLSGRKQFGTYRLFANCVLNWITKDLWYFSSTKIFSRCLKAEGIPPKSKQCATFLAVRRILIEISTNIWLWFDWITAFLIAGHFTTSISVYLFCLVEEYLSSFNINKAT